MIFDCLDFYLDDSPRAGPLNMAIDEALARSAAEPVLRVYRWANAPVSFGYFGRHSEVTARWPARELVRRWTGGGEVPHGDDFTYTLIVPRSHPFAALAVRESYRSIHQSLAALLPGSTLAGNDAAEAPACFARPVSADVLLAGRKVAGAAQRRGTFGLLHQGSIQGTVWPIDFATRLSHALARQVQERQLSTALLADAERLAAEKYATAAWLLRR